MLKAKELSRIEAGELVMRELETDHEKGQTTETIGEMNASGETIFKLLADYQSYPEFMSAVDGIEITDQTGNQATLNYTLKSMLGVTKKYRVEIVADTLADLVWKIEWHLVEWPSLTVMETIADTQGYWLIIEQASQKSLIQYYVYTDPGPLPFGLGGIVNALAKSSIKEVFLETRARAESGP